jgi:hypothetical protein
VKEQGADVLIAEKRTKKTHQDILMEDQTGKENDVFFFIYSSTSEKFQVRPIVTKQNKEQLAVAFSFILR